MNYNTKINQNQDENLDLQILEDGKNDWKTKKDDNLVIASLIKNNPHFIAKKDNRSTLNMNDNLYKCGDFLEFNIYSDGSQKLTKANFCRLRLCPMCAWRRSLKGFGQVSKIIDYLGDEYEYLILTLTVKNYEEGEHKQAIDHLLYSFEKMAKSKWWRTHFEGSYRGLEQTYSCKHNNYHPHFHLLVAVKKSYFKNYYVSQKEFTEKWQYFLKVDYTPIVHVQTVDKNNNKGHIAEVAKYPMKFSNIIQRRKNGKINVGLTQRVLYNFYVSFHGRRLVGMTGIFSEVHKKLKLDDVENGKLEDTDNVQDEIREDVVGVAQYFWNYSKGNYYKK